MSINKIDFLDDIQGNAHALLHYNWPTTYRILLRAWYWPNPEERRVNLRAWYIDDRANPELFYGLLAFAQPTIFKGIYPRHEKCLGMLLKALKKLYSDPEELELANKALDTNLDE